MPDENDGEDGEGQRCLVAFSESDDGSEKSVDEEHQRSALEDLVDFHFKFEIKEVCFFSVLM